MYGICIFKGNNSIALGIMYKTAAELSSSVKVFPPSISATSGN